MTGAETAQIITSLATLTGVVGGLIVSLRNSRKIEEVHKSTNGKMDELVQVVKKASFAEGMKAEKDGKKKQ
jgi:hypothetical protein